MFDLRSGQHTTARPRDEPGALEHPQVTGQTMKGSSTSTTVPGWGFCAVGATALVATAVAMRQRTINGWLAVWLAEALVAFTIALFSMQRKASGQGIDLLSTAGRTLLIMLQPALSG